MRNSNYDDRIEDFTINSFILLIILSPFLGSLSLIANNTSTVHSLWAGVAGSFMIMIHYVSNKTGIGSSKTINSISIVIIALIGWQIILHVS